MILVVGGLASGKKEFARTLGHPESEIALDAHELAREVESVDELVRMLEAKAVVTCAEVGSGIVPIDPEERAWRERVGRMSSALAERADAVVRMVCGIPVVLKGEGPVEPRTGGAAPTAAHLELVLIRHGKTPGNEAKKYVGVIDQPLSDAGREQALEAGAHDEVGRVYVSRLRRTHETAALMFPHAEQVVVEGIEEMDFGDFAGRSPDEMADDPAYRAWVDGMCEGACPHGESQGSFTDRVCDALEQLLRDAAARGEERIVMVAHGGTMMAFLSRYGNDPSKQYWEWLVGNCEGYRLGIDVSADGITLASIERW